MRKFKALFIVAMFAVTAMVSAQSTSFGVKGGLGISNLYGGDVENAKAIIGFNIGVFGDYEFAPGVGIQSGLSYVTKGAKYTDTEDNESASVNYGYLQLPVHFAYKTEVTPGTRIVFHAGPYAAYALSGKMKYGSISVDIFDKDEMTDGVFKRFDAGLGLGVGAEFGRIVVDLGWDMGLLEVAKDSEVKNQSGYLSIGYKF